MSDAADRLRALTQNYAYGDVMRKVMAAALREVLPEIKRYYMMWMDPDTLTEQETGAAQAALDEVYKMIRALADELEGKK